MKTSVRGYELATLLDEAPAGVRVLSLDCFDTLIWRDTHTPADVFARLPFGGGGREPRRWAETGARQAALAATGAKEIALADVYRKLHPGADPATLADAVSHELALEAAHAFAFAPAVALMREAKRRGLAVIIVSDMYLDEAQLRAHIAAADPSLLDLIDHVFVSAAHGTGKCDALFARVIAALGVRYDAILHVGDNRAADFTAPTALGIHAVHFQQFDSQAEARLRMEALAGTLIDPSVRTTRPAWQPHRAAIALRRDDDPAYVLGHDVIGPVMRAFARWLKVEIDAMALRVGRPVRPLFMMRDGHLPLRVFDALYPEAGARPVEISRLVAARAGLHDAAALDAYIDTWFVDTSVRTMARHLHLGAHEVARIDDNAPANRAVFLRFVRKPDTQRKILKRAGQFADKMVRHLAAADVGEGDAVMLIDLGYNGSVQNMIEPLLRERMGLDVAGRYLLLREGAPSGLDKRGMIDVRHYAHRVLQGLTGPIAVVEQLCNVEQGSTVDYATDGTPIRETPDAKAAHNAARVAVQDAALDHVRDADRAMIRTTPIVDPEAERHAAAATLARLLFLPDTREAALLATFFHDQNMGSGRTDDLFDAADAARGLRRHGLAYVNTVERMYLPGEIQRHGLPLSLALFTASCLGLDLRSTDFEVGGVEVPVMIVTASEQLIERFTAYPTAEGYYRLQVPIGTLRPTLGLQIGAICRSVQIDEVVFSPIDPKVTHDRAAAWMTDGMTLVADGIHTADPAGFVFVSPPGGGEAVVLSLIFRPLNWRSGSDGMAARAA